MARTQADEDVKDAVTLRFTGTGSGTRTYVGRVTGTRYRFSATDESMQTRRVHKRDVDGLMALGGFEEVSEQSAPAEEDTSSKPPKASAKSQAEADAEAARKAEEEAAASAKSKKA